MDECLNHNYIVLWHHKNMIYNVDWYYLLVQEIDLSRYFTLFREGFY